MKALSMATLWVTLVLLCITTIPVSAQDVELLKDIKSELLNIQDSLDELEDKFDTFYSTTISTVTTVDPTIPTTATGSTIPSTTTIPVPTSTAPASTTTIPESTTTPAATTTTPESTTTPTATTTTPESATTTPESTTTPTATTTTPESTTTPTATTTTPESTTTTPESTTTPAATTTTQESTTTAPESTATTTTVASELKVESGSFTADSKSPEPICVQESEGDLCSRLINVLDVVEGVVDEINNGTITENQLILLKNSSAEMKEIVDEADGKFFSNLNAVAFKSETKRIRDEVSNAIAAVDDLIPYEGPALVIVMGVLGGLVFLSFLVLAVYIAMQSSQRKKKEQQRKLNETRIPAASSAEEGNVNKGFVEEELPKVAVLPRFGQHSGNFYQDSATRGSSVKVDSMDRRKDRRPSTPTKSHCDDYDPYSLERRTANIRRAAAPGGLRRYDL
ncbi:uncharacterized protein LOC135213660 [Macrobrachium nipponense]|uniref:uncharacterized protein LOC135213660 n=1 Tax=Macrobrachium nipponense TaxID=159736 RepID=UPI0030C7F98A